MTPLVIVIIAVAAFILISAFYHLDRLIRTEHDFHHNTWLADGLHSSSAFGSTSDYGVTLRGCVFLGFGRLVHPFGFVRHPITFAVFDCCECSFSRGICRSLFLDSALSCCCGYHTKSSNQSLEPTADRRISSFIVNSTFNFIAERALISSGSAPSRWAPSTDRKQADQ